MKGTRANIDVGGVLVTGRALDVAQSVSLPDFASFRFSAPVAVALAVRRLGRGLELRGSIDSQVEGECARCLDDVKFSLHLDVDERFEPGREAEDPLAESNVLTGDELDLNDLVRQLIDSALPLVLLCNDDCRGLCATCGHKRDGIRPCGHPE